jgi:hypothetical protein
MRQPEAATRARTLLKRYGLGQLVSAADDRPSKSIDHWGGQVDKIARKYKFMYRM